MIRVQCYLAFDGTNLDFSEITETVGVQPSKTRRAGQPRYPGHRPQDSWQLAIEQWGCSRLAAKGAQPSPWPEISTLIAKLLQMIAGRESQIATYCASRCIDTLMVAVINSSDEQLPILSLPSSTLVALAALGATLEFDPYLNIGDDFGKHQRPDLWQLEQSIPVASE